MFKIFKKEKKETVEVLETETVKSKYPKEVEEIHNEFGRAAEDLLVEAREIIKNADTVNAAKISRLEKLGFIQCKEVIETKPIIQKATNSKELVELIKYYSSTYPKNKFITLSQVEDICKKYNLVCGDISRFKGFVPEQNLQEIEKFSLKPKDASTIIGELRDGTITTMANAHIYSSDGRYWHIYPKGSTEYSDHAFQSGDGIDFYSGDRNDKFKMKHLGDVRFTVVSNRMKICAPVKDMDLSNSTLMDGFRIVKHIPDPIVLQPVNGGYLMVTAWGDEAKDPEIQI